MSMTDPVADMLTRIRNGLRARHKEIIFGASNLKAEIARILKEEGYIKDFSLLKQDDLPHIKVQLKYAQASKGAITEIKRVSKPGLRVYVGKDEIPKVLNGLGIAILSTSKGIMTDRKAREMGIGGELLCTVF